MAAVTSLRQNAESFAAAGPAAPKNAAQAIAAALNVKSFFMFALLVSCICDPMLSSSRLMLVESYGEADD
jgi:hypothetical protein